MESAYKPGRHGSSGGGHIPCDPVAGGSPGITERQTVTGFTGDPSADSDGDGIQALIEYATGRSDETSDLGNLPFAAKVEMLEVDGITQSYLTFFFFRDNTRQDVTLQAELSTDLSTWSSENLVLHRETIGNELDTLLYRSGKTVTDENSAYFRLKATLK